MAEVFTEDYIAKILLLEKAVGHKVSYRLLDPFHVHTESADGYVDIQRAAKRIAEFVGLTGLTFLIEPTRLAEGVCGRNRASICWHGGVCLDFSRSFRFS